MKNERPMKSADSSANSSRIGSSSVRYFSFLDRSHSVFSRTNYYNDMLSVHPWSRRPISRHSGIPFPALYDSPCSAHMDELARPKLRRENHIRQEVLDNYFNYAYSGVPPGALTYQCSEPLAALAQPRQASTTTNKNSQKHPQEQQPVPGNDPRANASATNNKNSKKHPKQQQPAPGNDPHANTSATNNKNSQKHPKQQQQQPTPGNDPRANESATNNKNSQKHPKQQQPAPGNDPRANESASNNKNSQKPPKQQQQQASENDPRANASATNSKNSQKPPKQQQQQASGIDALAQPSNRANASAKPKHK